MNSYKIEPTAENRPSYCTGFKQVIDNWPAVPVEWEGEDIEWKPVGPPEPIKIVILDPHDSRIFSFYDYMGGQFLPTGWVDDGPDHEEGDCHHMHFLHQGC